MLSARPLLTARSPSPLLLRPCVRLLYRVRRSPETPPSILHTHTSPFRKPPCPVRTSVSIRDRRASCANDCVHLQTLRTSRVRCVYSSRQASLCGSDDCAADQFVNFYYTSFDENRANLAPLYVSHRGLFSRGRSLANQPRNSATCPPSRSRTRNRPAPALSSRSSL